MPSPEAERYAPRMARLGSVEGGGTKFVCAVGSSIDEISAVTTVPTTTPDETLGRVIDFLSEHGPLDAVGIATFGPLDLHERSATYGRVVGTPKRGWNGADIVGAASRSLGTPVGFDTDVNGAALGEGRWGAGRGLDTFAYITVGTGVGMGAVVNGAPVHGLVHPEFGHIRVPRDADDDFPGHCPYHGDCLEGLVAGPALAARWGRPATELGAITERAVATAAHSLGHAIASLVVTLSPERIIVGGGVAKLPGLLEATRVQMVRSLNGYVTSPAVAGGAVDYVVPPALGDRAGIAGGLVLAERAMHR